MKNLNLKKLLAAVAIVVVAGGIGVQKASSLEIDESLNPIITSRDFVKSETKMDIRSTASIDDVMNPIITSETILSHK